MNQHKDDEILELLRKQEARAERRSEQSDLITKWAIGFFIAAIVVFGIANMMPSSDTDPTNGLNDKDIHQVLVFIGLLILIGTILAVIAKFREP